MKVIFILIIMFLSMITNNVFGYNYERKAINSHVIHIIRFEPDEYEAEIIKANNGNIGRETVSSIAKKAQATVAINGGFFEIGGKNDGKASGSLVIHGKIYNIKKQKQSLVIIKDGVVSIKQEKPKNYQNTSISLVSGIPMLLQNGEIQSEIFNKKSNFYKKPYARTALGINSNGQLIIVVVEHMYIRDIIAVTMGELQSIIKRKGKTFVQKYNKKDMGEITLSELEQILEEEFVTEKVQRDSQF